MIALFAFSNFRSFDRVEILAINASEVGWRGSKLGRLAFPCRSCLNFDRWFLLRNCAGILFPAGEGEVESVYFPLT